MLGFMSSPSRARLATDEPTEAQQIPSAAGAIRRPICLVVRLLLIRNQRQPQMTFPLKPCVH